MYWELWEHMEKIKWKWKGISKWRINIYAFCITFREIKNRNEKNRESDWIEFHGGNSLQITDFCSVKILQYL